MILLVISVVLYSCLLISIGELRALVKIEKMIEKRKGE